MRLVVVGGSAGALEGLFELVAALPGDFEAMLAIVIHTSPDYRSYLPELLGHRSLLPAGIARDGQPLEPGRIVVAPAGYHLLIYDGHLRLWRGPKEHYTRPAADPLFRTAAAVYGEAVIGVLLSGGLSDGTLGFQAIRAGGGTTLVQDPATSLVPDMPAKAIAAGVVDEVLSIPALGRRLVELVAGSVVTEGQAMLPDKPLQERVDHDIAAQLEGARSGLTSVFTCPDCGGTMWQLDSGETIHFRCHIGHVYGSEEFVMRQAETAEGALWFAVRILLDQTRLLAQMSRKARSLGHDSAADHFEQQAALVEEHIARLRSLIGDSVHGG